MGKQSLSECDPERVLASLPPDTMDRLADLVVAKLKGTSPCSLLPKQDVVGSNSITRSTKLKDKALNACIGRGLPRKLR